MTLMNSFDRVGQSTYFPVGNMLARCYTFHTREHLSQQPLELEKYSIDSSMIVLDCSLRR